MALVGPAETSPPRVIFMGSPEFAVPSLTALCDMAVDVVGVVSQPDRPAGRGRRLTPPPVAAYAHDQGLQLYQPTKVRDGSLEQWVRSLSADIAVVIAYGRVLPLAVLEAPRMGCVNLHASLLPRWRGASPIQRAIAAGDALTGVCLMAMDEGLDTGDVYARTSLTISDDDTASTLGKKLADLSAQLLTEHLSSILAGTLTATPQSAEGVTYASLLTKSEGSLPWSQSAPQVHAHLRAMTPWPGAWSSLADTGERWKFFPEDARVDPRPGPAGQAVEIDDQSVRIGLGQGSIWLRWLQRPGKRRVHAAEAVRSLGSLAHARWREADEPKETP